MTTTAIESPGASESQGPVAALVGAASGGLVMLYGWFLYQTAWTCDDAYISYRCLDNWINGYGLTYNPLDRVQAFTHPLWLFWNAIPYAITGEPFYTFIGVSMATSLAAILLFQVLANRSALLGLVGLWVLINSRAFMDYSTSGLENPLTHVLLAAFVIAYMQMRGGENRILVLSFVAALGTINRLDSLLLFGPGLAFALYEQRSLAAVRLAILGFLPLVLWELFSLFYYGSLVPNTAYAKLGTGIPRGEMLVQGLHYVENVIRRDPVTPVAILAGLGAPLLGRSWKLAPLSAGMLLYLVYIVWIGGDFMAGRFFTPVLFLGVLTLAQVQPPGPGMAYVPAFAAVAVLGFLAPHPALLNGADYGSWGEGKTDAYRIADERAFYYPSCGLLRAEPGVAMPRHRYANEGRDYRLQDRVLVKLHQSAGFRGFFGGPKLLVVDEYALADPVLARLPARYAPKWRIGHFQRAVPDGYLAAIEAKLGIRASGSVPAFADPGLASLYDAVDGALRDSPWRFDRFGDIQQLLTQGYADNLERDRYRFPGLRRVDVAQAGLESGVIPRALGTLPRSGLELSYGATITAPAIRLAAGIRATVAVVFLRDGEVVHRISPVGPASAPNRQGLGVYDLRLPAEITVRGYDAIRILTLEPRTPAVVQFLAPIAG